MMDWKERYSRQIMLPELGEEGQKRLLGSSVLVVGTGGLGSPIATYLCAAGVGRIGLIDADTVSVSNLQRQVLYSEEEVGMSKVACAEFAIAVCPTLPAGLLAPALLYASAGLSPAAFKSAIPL